MLVLGSLPVPRKQFIDALGGMPGQSRDDVGEQARGSTSLRRQVSISVYMAAARCPPVSDPAKVQFRRPTAMGRIARSAALFDRELRRSKLGESALQIKRSAASRKS